MIFSCTEGARAVGEDAWGWSMRGYASRRGPRPRSLIARKGATATHGSHPAPLSLVFVRGLALVPSRMVRKKKTQYAKQQKTGVQTTTSGGRVNVASDGYTQREKGKPTSLSIRRIIFLMLAVGLRSALILATFPAVGPPHFPCALRRPFASSVPARESTPAGARAWCLGDHAMEPWCASFNPFRQETVAVP